MGNNEEKMDGYLEEHIKKVEYQEKQYEANQKSLKERASAWESKECQKLYRKIVEYAGGFSIVRKGIQGKAKELAITCYLRGQVPDFETFKLNVDIANKKRDENKNNNWRRR